MWIWPLFCNCCATTALPLCTLLLYSDDIATQIRAIVDTIYHAWQTNNSSHLILLLTPAKRVKIQQGSIYSSVVKTEHLFRFTYLATHKMTSFCDLYVFNARTNCPATLHQQCYQYIAMHLELFPFNSLMLLPLKTRWNLLWNLPIADVCLLEATQFIQGIDMDDYWRTIVRTDVQDLGCHSECFNCILDNELCSPCRWKAIVESTAAKEWVYAVIAAEAITEIGIMEKLPPSRNCTPLYSTVVAIQPIRNFKRDDLYAFLYAVRRFYQGDSRWYTTAGVECEFEFPSRYREYAVPILTLEESRHQYNRFYLMDALERKSLLDAIVCCFGGKKPCLLSTRRGLLGDISEEVTDFLSDLKFFTCQICEPQTELPSLETALKGTACLEVLLIQNGCDRFSWPSVSLDSLFTHITNQPFLASISILAVSAGDHSYFEISKDVFDNLKQALSSTSCDYHRSIQAEGGTIIRESGNNTKHLPYTTIYNFCENCSDVHAFP